MRILFFLQLIITIASGCSKEKLANQNALINTWVHSYEENTKDHNIWRPEHFRQPWPPSFGRGKLEIMEDQKVIYHRPAPADGTDPYSGTWEYDGVELILRVKAPFGDNPEEEIITFEIASLTKDRIKIKR